jgi:HSP20 family protein
MKTLMQPPELTTIKDEIDRFFHRVMNGDEYAWMTEGDWQPAMDLTETPTAVLCRMDVPGIDPKDIHVTVREGVLTVRGERKSEIEEKEATRYRLERKLGAFMRGIRLPVRVDEKHVVAEFKNGLLTITMPRLQKETGAITEVPVKIA